MQYTRLGTTGLIVSRFAFGTMTFGTDPRFPAVAKVDLDSAKAMTDRAFDAGVNFFDTADLYSGGESEVYLGKFLGPRRKDVVVATKVGFRSGEAITQAGLSRRHIFEGCDSSLKKLGTDWIDLYIVHKVDVFTPVEETLEALNDLVRAGKVRYIGFSNWPAWQAASALAIQKERGWARFTSGQMYYSLVTRDLDHEFVPFLQATGTGMNIWSPLAGGFLSGKYTRESFQQKEREKDKGNRLAGVDFIPFDKELGFRVVEKLREIGRAHGASVAQIALAWLLTKPFVTSVILGATKNHSGYCRGGAVIWSSVAISESSNFTSIAPKLSSSWLIMAVTTDPKHKEALGETPVRLAAGAAGS
jgi:aryl-alcohol dehydrogenase-like predicted oxidoreductase